VRAGLTRLGIEAVVPPEQSSVVLPAYRLPTGLTYATPHDALKAERFVIYSGQGELSKALSADIDRMPNCFMHRVRTPRHVAIALIWGGVSLLVGPPSWSGADDVAAQASAPPPVEPGVLPAAPAPRTGLSRWFSPGTAPFIPIPSIGVDPDSGTTLGVLPTWVHTDEHHAIRRIIAPDVLYNPNFGLGVHGRLYAYPSADEQWSILMGITERVERSFSAAYQNGRLREKRWSVNAGLIFDRSGTPRFFGIGNESLASSETNYTNEQQLAQVQIGLNFTHAWQLLYTAREQIVDVLPGTLKRVPSIETRFDHILGVGTNDLRLNRLAIVYDTRDDLTVPTRGAQWVAYGGVASRRGVFNDSMYSEAGLDGRAFWAVAPRTILAAHVALRYLPSARAVPFWALSSIGGDRSEIGGEQPLRGFGGGRYYDRDSFSTTVEVRRTVASFDAVSTYVDFEVAPFVDLGRVFERSSTFPLQQLHHVFGVGFRGLARPFVVGYVDIGYGSGGVAAFTGINYPF
jgi:Omp85 superfamily domain